MGAGGRLVGFYTLVIVLALIEAVSGLSDAEKELALSVLPTEHAACNAAGSSWSYTEILNRVHSTRTVRTNTCPNHYSVCQLGWCAGDRVTKALRQPLDAHTYDLPLYPGFVMDTMMVDATCSSSPVAIALNGVPMYGMADPAVASTCVSVSEYDRSYPRVGRKALKPCNLHGINDGVKYCGDALLANAAQMDKCGGYTDADGQYRYQGMPVCLVQQLEEERAARAAAAGSQAAMLEDGIQVTVSPMLVNDHGIQLAWALDGFPVYYGARGPKGVVMKTCGTAGAHADFCLDECNGYEGALDDVDYFRYRYYVAGPLPTGECSDTTEGLGLNSTCARVNDKCCLSGVPTADARPYTIGCFKGCRAGSGDCKYMPGALPGTTSFYQSAAVTVTPEGAFFGLTATHPAPDVPAAPAAAAAPASSPTLPLAAGVENVAFRFSNNRSFGLISADGIVTTLPSGATDAYISGVAVDRAGADASLAETSMYFTTQREILVVPVASSSGVLSTPTSVLAGAIYVTVRGHNLGREGRDGADLTVTVQGERCSSLVRIDASEIQCNVLTLAPPYTVVPDDVHLVGLGEGTTGPTMHHSLAAVSGKSVISSVEFEVSAFTPYAVAVSPHQSSVPGWLYWSNVGSGDAAPTGVFRARRTTDFIEVVNGPELSQVSSLVVFHPDAGSAAAAAVDAVMGAGVASELVFFAEARSARVGVTVVEVAARGCGRGCNQPHTYTLLMGVEGVVSVALDHAPGERAQLLVTQRDGEILAVDLETALPAALAEDAPPAVDAGRRDTWQAYVTRVASLSSRSRLSGVAVVSGPNPSADAARLRPNAWSFQRIFVADTNQQKIYAVSESGFPLLPMNVGLDHDASKVIWPFEVAAVWTPPPDLPTNDKQYVTLLVAEYLGRIWRYELALNPLTGKVDADAYRTTRPTLVVDLSAFGASQQLRATFAAEAAAGATVPSTFFEAYG